MSQHNAKYSFYYLLSLLALIFMALSVGMILFGIIDSSITDAFAYNSYRNLDSQFKFAISALLISAPIYYVTLSLINKGLVKQELSLASSLRRWLTYLIIFVNAVIILGVLIAIVNNFLSGALTLRFLLKFLSVLLIASAIFSYYFYDIKRTEVLAQSLFRRLFAWISGALILVVFISAWFFVDLPQEARAKRLDQNLMNNIYQLENAVNNYYSLYGVLPENIEELQNNQDVYLDKSHLSDPETGELIEYKKEGEEGFAFCANFRRDSEETERGRIVDKSYQAGYSCVAGQLWVQAQDSIMGEKALRKN
ncbi:MAG: DUF5671 domain-containing protein [Patescibacteria group bacterium]|nr:DUF5671 domain-containing protein [Patescibacteria group bacterium]